jgi:UV DNA damage endonuclease
MNIGYCCISMGINEGKKKKDHILVNRGLVKKTFDSKGLPYVSELIVLNLQDTIKVIDWNIKNNILVYRMSSDSFPWMTHYRFEDLPNFDKIKNLLKKIGDLIKFSGMRVSYHPGPFNVLGSENPDVITKTIDELNKHAELMDLMELEKSNYYPINIHIGTTKPNHQVAMDRFCQGFNLLSDSCKKRLTVENDDSPTQYSVQMLYNGIYRKIGIPIVFDQFHFLYGPQDQSMEDALKLALSTWKVKPLTHMSSSRKLEDSKSKSTAHADYIYESIQTYDCDFDIEIEAKAKDLAVLKYRKEFRS